MITQRFAVEYDRRTVGVAVRVPGGFMFYASDDRFDELDGRMFPKARAIERGLNTLAERKPAHRLPQRLPIAWPRRRTKHSKDHRRLS